MNISLSPFAFRLAVLSDRNELDVRDIAAYLRVENAVVEQWLAGDTQPTVFELLQLADLLEITPTELVKDIPGLEQLFALDTREHFNKKKTVEPE